MIIQNILDGKAASTTQMITQVEDADFRPEISFENDCFLNRNIISFLVKINAKKPIVTFNTVFPAKSVDPKGQVNSLINYLNLHPRENNRVIIKLGGTNEKQRKKKFGPVYSIADISKFFAKQPRCCKKFILEFDSTMEIEPSRIINCFDVNNFLVRLIQGEIKDTPRAKKKAEETYEKIKNDFKLRGCQMEDDMNEGE